MEQFFSVMSVHWYWFSDVHICVALISFQMSFAIRFGIINWLLVQLIC